MKTTQDEQVPFRLFTTSHLGPEGLTEEMVKNYLAKGRRLRSEYFVGLLAKSGRLVKEMLGWTGKLFGRTLAGKHTAVGILFPESHLGQTNCKTCKNRP